MQSSFAARLLILFLALSPPARAGIFGDCIRRVVSAVRPAGDVAESLSKRIAAFVTESGEARAQVLAELRTFARELPKDEALRLEALLSKSEIRLDSTNFAAFKRAARRAAEKQFGAENRLAYYLEVESHPDRFKPFSRKELDAGYARVNEAANPYTTAAHLKADPKWGKYGRTGELLDFEALTHLEKSTAARMHEIKKWVKSEEHALYLYQHLEDFGKDADGVFAYLIRENEYFKRVGRVRGPPRTVVTYAFEKETQNPIVTLFYRPPEYSFEAWEKLSEAERVRILKANTGLKQKTFLPADVLAPTDYKPTYLGGYSQEVGVGRGNFTWEFAHRNYEIDRERLLVEMRDLSGQLKETHSFHVHVVFDLPKTYAHEKEFVTWTKQLNDYLYLSGMEEGLHGNELTRLAELPKKTGAVGGLLERVKRLNPLYSSKTLPTALAAVDQRMYKFFSAGVRRGMYGASKDAAYVKTGIELRDATRNLDKWKSLVERVGTTVETKSWEGARVDEGALRLRNADERDLAVLGQFGISEKVGKEMIEHEPTLRIALERFESGRYYNYKTRSFEAVAPEHAKEIVEARQQFIKDLQGLDKEVADIRARGDKVEPEEMQMAIRMSLSEWAKRAHVSSLLGGI